MRIVKPTSTQEKQTRTTMDVVELTEKLVSSWKCPPFQRDLKVNAKVLGVAEEVRQNGGVVPGILTIGVLDGDTYVVDGQHRIAAWRQTGMDIGYADVRMIWFDTMGAMANEFVRLNSSLVKLRPDDILRGIEPSSDALRLIRNKCPFIGYDMVRRGGTHSPVLSMSVFLRCWSQARGEVPGGSGSSLEALKIMDENETTNAIAFVQACFEAWRRDIEHARLWGALNLTLCAWLYRRLVLNERATSSSRVPTFTMPEFRKCLMALSADSLYLDYLLGRNLGDRDRAPTYARIKTIFQQRFLAEKGKQIRLPSPTWSHQ